MKKILMMLLAMTMLLGLVACGGSDEPEATPAPEAVEDTLDDAAAVEGEEAVEPADAETADAEPAEELTFTGIIEEKKDFMVIVTSEDGAEAYVFTLADGVECEAAEGDKVTVTYTGDLEKFITDDAELLASKIELAE